jgi:glycosyltransferase involved in cell wall biosynthesis
LSVKGNLGAAVDTMANSSLISVIIPVYNGEKYLAETLESILAQTYDPLEIFVVDDGSDDRSTEIAHSYPGVRVISQVNAGAAAARNRGLQEATGEFIAFLDADDLWTPGKLVLQTAAFADDPDYDIVTGHVQEFLSPEIENQKGRVFHFEARPLLGYSPTAILARRGVFDTVGLFHAHLRVGEVISWFSIVLESNLNIGILPDVVARRRIHGENTSTRFQDEKNETILKIIKTSLDRKRAKS